jgi:hypothetical protein
MDGHTTDDDPSPAAETPAAGDVADGEVAGTETAPQVTVTAASAGGRLLAAAVPLPWLLGYGITGTWAVTRGATAASAGLKTIDAGYTRMVGPAGVMLVGGLLLAAFAVLLAASLLLVLGGRRLAQWVPVAVVAGVLTAGSVWAAVSGGLHPALWVLFFFGLAYAFVVALVQARRAARRPGRGSVVVP